MQNNYENEALEVAGLLETLARAKWGGFSEYGFLLGLLEAAQRRINALEVDSFHKGKIVSDILLCFREYNKENLAEFEVISKTLIEGKSFTVQ